MSVENAVAVPREDEYPVPVRTEWKILGRVRVNAPHLTKNDIAARLGYSYATIARWLDSAAYQRYENFLLGKEIGNLFPEVSADEVAVNVRARYLSYAEEMQQRVYDIIESTTDNKLQADLALDWLDRAGFTPVKKEQKLGVTLTLTADAVEILKQRAAEAGL